MLCSDVGGLTVYEDDLAPETRYFFLKMLWYNWHVHTCTESLGALLATRDCPVKVQDCLIGQNAKTEVFQGVNIPFYVAIFLYLMLKSLIFWQRLCVFLIQWQLIFWARKEKMCTYNQRTLEQILWGTGYRYRKIICWQISELHVSSLCKRLSRSC